MLTADQLRRLCPRLTIEQCVGWASELTAAAAEFGIDTPLRFGHFLSQLLHESAGLTAFEENLNYSPKRLAQVWPRRYAEDSRAVDLRPNMLAVQIGGDPRKVANDVYAGRLGNGPPESGDGWRYRGRGPIQLTGKENYATAGAYLQLPLVEQPDLVLQPDVGSRVAGWFWASRGCNRYADVDDIGAITRLINGGQHGLQDRMAWYQRVAGVLGAS